MIKYICEYCGDGYHDHLAFVSHGCDASTTELPNGLLMCDDCWTPAPCSKHQPRLYAEFRDHGGDAA